MTPASAAAKRGSVSVLALACLAVVASLALVVVRGAILGRGSLRSERSARQVECLLDAAAAWAEVQLEAGRDPAALRGIPAAEIVGTSDAALEIAATPVGGSWRLRIVATYPLHGPHLVRRTRETTVVVTARPPQESLP